MCNYMVTWQRWHHTDHHSFGLEGLAGTLTVHSLYWLCIEYSFALEGLAGSLAVHSSLALHRMAKTLVQCVGVRVGAAFVDHGTVFKRFVCTWPRFPRFT